MEPKGALSHSSEAKAKPILREPRSLIPLRLTDELQAALQHFSLEPGEVKEIVLGTSGLRATYIFGGFDKILVSERVPASAVMLHKRTRRLTLIVNPRFVKTALLAKVSQRKHRNHPTKPRSEDFLQMNLALQEDEDNELQGEVLTDIVTHEFSHVWFHHLERTSKHSKFMVELVHGALLTHHMKLDLNLTTFFPSDSDKLFHAALMFPNWVWAAISRYSPRAEDLYNIVTEKYSTNLDDDDYVAWRCFQALKSRSSLQPKPLSNKFFAYAKAVKDYEEGIEKLIERLLEMFPDMDEPEIPQFTFFSPPPNGGEPDEDGEGQEGDGNGTGICVEIRQDEESDGEDAQDGSEGAKPEDGADTGGSGDSGEDQESSDSGDDSDGGDGPGGDGDEAEGASGGLSGTGMSDVPDDSRDDEEGNDAGSDPDEDSSGDGESDGEVDDDLDDDGDADSDADDEEGDPEGDPEEEDNLEEEEVRGDQGEDESEDGKEDPAEEDPEYEVPEKEPEEVDDGEPRQIDPHKEELELDGETYLPMKDGSIPPDFDEQVASIMKSAGASGSFIHAMMGDIDEAKLQQETIKAVLKVSTKSLIQYARQKLDLALKPSPVSTTIVPNRHPVISDMVLNNALSLGRPPRYRPIRAREDAIRRKKVRLYIDVSGSMTSAWEDIVAFSIGLNKHCDLEVFQFSTDIKELTIAELKQGVIKTWGGTNVTPIVNDIIEASRICDAFTIMGDRMYNGLNHVPRVAKPITILDIAYNTTNRKAHFRPTDNCTVHFVNLNDDFSLIEEGIVER